MLYFGKIAAGAAAMIVAFLLGRSAAKTRVLVFGVPTPMEEPTAPAEEPVVPVAEPTAPPAAPVAEPTPIFVFMTERPTPQPQPRDLPSTFGWAMVGVAVLVFAAIMAALVIALSGYDDDQSELREELTALQVEHAVLEERHSIYIGACADTVPYKPTNNPSPTPRPEYIRALRVIDGELVYAACISSSAVLDGKITGP